MNTFLKARKNLSAIREFTEGIFELDEVLKDLGDFDKIKATYVAQIADLEKASDALKAENAKTSKSTSDLMATARKEADQIRSEAQDVLDKANQRFKEVDSLVLKATADAADIINSAQKKAELEVKGIGNELARVRIELSKALEEKNSIIDEIEQNRKSLEKTKSDLRAIKDKIAA